MGKTETLATIWEIPDHLWEQIHPVILELDRPRPRAANALPPDGCWTASFSGMRSGCQWNRLPKELGDDSTIHRTFQRWVQLGVLERIWSVLVKECEELGGVEWEWQAVDCAMGKARFGGIQSDPTPRTGPRQAASGVFWLTGARPAERGGGWGQRSRHQTAAADTGEHRSGPP